MKKLSVIYLLVLFVVLFVLYPFDLSVLADESPFKGQILTIYNVEDYISSGEDDSVDLISEFEELYDVTVNYYTYDTNETMYNQFTLQKEGTYDLVCTSDYMIQKMIKEGLVMPMDDYETHIPNYANYASNALRDKLRAMEVEYNGEVVNLDQFAVGYMWGTLGIIYDPECSDTIREDVKSWDVFWDSKYANLISLKNSMRDAYVSGLMYSYSKSDDFKAIQSAYLNDPSLENRLAYNNLIQDIFDFKLDGSSESEAENYEKIAKVQDALTSVKDNIFGFEVDSGKNDIITGKIKLNLAYSGDAVYSIDTAREEADKLLEYYVPEDGSNIWYDAWTLPKGSNKELAYAFLDFLSDPANAACNMDYIGYTPYIVGDELFTLAASKYGAADFDASAEYDEEVLVIYNNELYVTIKATEEGILPTNTEYFESLEFDEERKYSEGDLLSYQTKIYACIEDSIGEEPNTSDKFEEVEGYDLSYLFGETLSEGRRALIFAYPESLNQLETQYPSEYTIARCAIMNDFGKYNESVIIAWGQIKAYTNMTPVYVFLSIVVVSVVTIFVITFIQKNRSVKNKRAIAKIKG